MSTRRKPRSRPEPPPQRPQRSATASLGDYLRRQRELANVSLRKLSEQSGVSAAVLKEIESGLRHPSRTLLQSLAGAIRLSAETLYLQAGVLDPQSVDESPTAREIRRGYAFITASTLEFLATGVALALAARSYNREGSTASMR